MDGCRNQFGQLWPESGLSKASPSIKIHTATTTKNWLGWSSHKPLQGLTATGFGRI